MDNILLIVDRVAPILGAIFFIYIGFRHFYILFIRDGGKEYDSRNLRALPWLHVSPKPKIGFFWDIHKVGGDPD